MNNYHRRFMTIEERLAAMIGSPNERGCRLWLGQRKASGKTSTNGYGYIKIDGVHRRVTRVLWERKHGEIPTEMCVLHTCDTPPCCEETHLFLGTVFDNNRDMFMKGRHARGPAFHRGLNEAQARSVFELRREGKTYRAIGNEFGVTAQAIYLIVHGKNWRCLQEVV